MFFNCDYIVVIFESGKYVNFVGNLWLVMFFFYFYDGIIGLWREGEGVINC